MGNDKNVNEGKFLLHLSYLLLSVRPLSKTDQRYLEIAETATITTFYIERSAELGPQYCQRIIIMLVLSSLLT